MTPERVRIREVGPRDGFQNEPEIVPTDEKVRLIDLLARTGVRRLEVTSFVRADVIPQLADAEEVLDRIDPPGGRRRLRPDPEREGARERAAPARALPGDQRLPERVGDAQPQERQPLDRGVAERARARPRPRARGGPALRGRDLGRVRLPLRGPRAARAGVRDRPPAARGGRAGGRLRRHHRHGEPGAGAGVLRRGARRARRRGRADRALPQHARPGARQRARRARRRGGLVRVELRRARRLPGPARRDGQHRDRGPRLDAARDGDRDRHLARAPARGGALRPGRARPHARLARADRGPGRSGARRLLPAGRAAARRGAARRGGARPRGGDRGVAARAPQGALAQPADGGGPGRVGEAAAIEDAPAHALADVELHLPFAVADYVDFYSSLHHATNAGRMLPAGRRPAAAQLAPSPRRLPRPRRHGRRERHADRAAPAASSGGASTARRDASMSSSSWAS